MNPRDKHSREQHRRKDSGCVKATRAPNLPLGRQTRGKALEESLAGGENQQKGEGEFKTRRAVGGSQTRQRPALRLAAEDTVHRNQMREPMTSDVTNKIAGGDDQFWNQNEIRSVAGTGGAHSSPTPDTNRTRKKKLSKTRWWEKLRQ
jgi:hypothetical protein